MSATVTHEVTQPPRGRPPDRSAPQATGGIEMYAQNDSTGPSSSSSATRPTRATLRSRPRIQRTFIRSWEYIQPVRVTVLVIRLLVVVWLVFLGAALLSAGNTWGWILPPAAAAVLALSVWIFTTAAKGWPVVKV
jgi:hypothetical protein